jgi:hypothetical protein
VGVGVVIATFLLLLAMFAVSRVFFRRLAMLPVLAMGSVLFRRLIVLSVLAVFRVFAMLAVSVMFLRGLAMLGMARRAFIVLTVSIGGCGSISALLEALEARAAKQGDQQQARRRRGAIN